MLRTAFLLACALGCGSSVALAQTAVPAPDKKTESGKGKDAEVAKSKDTAKSKTGDPAKIPLDQAKLPKNAVVVVVDNILDAWSMFPKSAVLPFEKYQELLNEIDALKRQLKTDKRRPSSCTLHGKVEGDYLLFRAEFGFFTDQPKTTIIVGLQGGHLTDEGELDGQAPNLDYSDDGFAVRVETDGNHRLTLNFRVPIQIKKSINGASERGIELGLPGAAATNVHLDLPTNIKELRWNDTLEKTKKRGRWQISGLEKSKTLTLAWKEPLSLSGNAPLAKVEGLITVRIDEKFVTTTADLFLEDSRLQTKEWRLLLPPQAKVDVKAPGGLTFEWLTPDGKTPYHTLRISEATAERWQVSVFVSTPRPNPGAHVPVGPFYVLGAFQQQGTINVQMPAEVSFGQRLVFTRSGETFQVKNTETETVFQYLAPPVSDKNLKALLALKTPLELEWRYEKNQLETHVEHALKWKTANQGWEIDATTKIHVKALFSAFNTVEIKLPLPRPRGLSLIGTAIPGTSFPGCVPWSGMWKTFGMPWTDANPEEFSVQDDLGNPLKLMPQDATGKTRVVWDRSPTKQMTLILKNTFRIPPQNRRIRMELPRPINTQDRGAKLTMQADDRIEILHGPANAEEPVPERHRFDLSWDQSPAYVDLAWRPFHRDIVAHSTIDVTLHEHTAQIQQTLRFPRDRTESGLDSKATHVRLIVPRDVQKVIVLPEGEILEPSPVQQTRWLRLPTNGADQVELVLQYDLPITKKLHLTPIWPAHVSQKDVKVRVWCSAGVTSRLAEESFDRGLWKERSIEVAPGKSQFPTLVLQGYGSSLPLTFKIEATTSSTLAAFLADRALVQVVIGDDGSQYVRARYLLRKIQAPHVDVELPLPVSRLRGRPNLAIGKHTIEQWTVLDLTDNVLRLELHPELVVLPAVLEIQYTIPADALERSSSWKTTLHAPIFRPEAVIGQMRWQLSVPTPVIAASLGRNVRADTEWALQGCLLTPEPSVSGADLDTWLANKEPTRSPLPVTYSFAHVSQQPETVYHFPRWGWWLGCSGIFLVLTLGGFFASLPRLVFWLILLLLAASLLTLGVLCPAALSPVLFGVQPGLVLFLVFVASHWCMQERYRRQLVFMTGFTRAKPNSTLIRTNSAKRPREASTVDSPGAPPAPTPSGSPSGS